MIPLPFGQILPDMAMSTNVQKASDHVGRGVVNDTRRRRGWKAGTRGLSVAGLWLFMWKVGNLRSLET